MPQDAACQRPCRGVTPPGTDCVGHLAKKDGLEDQLWGVDFHAVISEYPEGMKRLHTSTDSLLHMFTDWQLLIVTPGIFRLATCSIPDKFGGGEFKDLFLLLASIHTLPAGLLQHHADWNSWCPDEVTAVYTKGYMIWCNMVEVVLKSWQDGQFNLVHGTETKK